MWTYRKNSFDPTRELTCLEKTKWEGTPPPRWLFRDEYDPIFTNFMSEKNREWLSGQSLKHGFNSKTSPSDLNLIMMLVWQRNKPYGYNLLDYEFKETHNPDYHKFFLEKLNSQVVNEIVTRMNQMRQAQKLYLYDVKTHGTRGLESIGLPMSDNRRRCTSLNGGTDRLPTTEYK